MADLKLAKAPKEATLKHIVQIFAFLCDGVDDDADWLTWFETETSLLFISLSYSGDEEYDI